MIKHIINFEIKNASYSEKIVHLFKPFTDTDDLKVKVLEFDKPESTLPVDYNDFISSKMSLASGYVVAKTQKTILFGASGHAFTIPVTVFYPGKKPITFITPINPLQFQNGVSEINRCFVLFKGVMVQIIMPPKTELLISFFIEAVITGSNNEMIENVQKYVPAAQQTLDNLVKKVDDLTEMVKKLKK